MAKTDPQLLKTYNSTYERKVAAVFTRDDIMAFLSSELHERAGASPYWILPKCYAAIAFSGGLRTAEMKSLNFEDLKELQTGIKVTYRPAKQKVPTTKSFFIQKNDENPAHSLASCHRLSQEGKGIIWGASQRLTFPYLPQEWVWQACYGISLLYSHRKRGNKVPQDSKSRALYRAHLLQAFSNSCCRPRGYFCGVPSEFQQER